MKKILSIRKNCSLNFASFLWSLDSLSFFFFYIFFSTLTYYHHHYWSMPPLTATIFDDSPPPLFSHFLLVSISFSPNFFFFCYLFYVFLFFFSSLFPHFYFFATFHPWFPKERGYFIFILHWLLLIIFIIFKYAFTWFRCYLWTLGWVQTRIFHDFLLVKDYIYATYLNYFKNENKSRKKTLKENLTS